MQLKVKRVHPDAVLPSKAKKGDTGYDVVAIDDGVWSDDRTYIEYSTGLSVELPEGFDIKIFPRSSISKTDLVLANSVGVCDNGYRGLIKIRLKYIPVIESYGGKITLRHPPLLYKKGDKIAQLVIQKVEEAEVVEVSELSSTERGEGGFGSSGQ